MALIKCPECEKEISDKAKRCICCGYPLEKYAVDIKKFEDDMEACPFCNYANKRSLDYCGGCGAELQNNNKMFKYVWLKAPKKMGEKTCCPSCGSTNFHAFVEEVVIREGKVKSQTTLNLNLFKPFTVFNHKEKVVRQPWTKQVSKFVCDDCGKIFQ